MEPKASNILDRCSTTGLYSQSELLNFPQNGLKIIKNLQVIAYLSIPHQVIRANLYWEGNEILK
jgi:hypothetical protein